MTSSERFRTVLAMQSEPKRIPQNGQAIREFRRREGWSIDGLANEIVRLAAKQGVRISGPHLRSIENENKSASDLHLSWIARCLNVELRAIRRFDDRVERAS